MYIYIIYIYVCICPWCIYIYTYVHMYIYMYIYMYIDILYIYMYVYVHGVIKEVSFQDCITFNETSGIVVLVVCLLLLSPLHDEILRCIFV